MVGVVLGFCAMLASVLVVAQAADDDGVPVNGAAVAGQAGISSLLP